MLCRNIVYLFIFFLFLTPTLKFGNLIGVRLEEIYILILSTLLITDLFFKKSHFLHLTSSHYFFFPFFILVPLSSLVGFIYEVPASLGDLNQYSRFYKYFFIYSCTVNACFSLPGAFYYILNDFFSLSIFSCFIGLQQYFDLFGLNSFYIPFVAPSQQESLFRGNRIIGMIGNPNDYGFLLSLSFIVTTFLYIHFGGKKYFFGLLLQAYVLILSMSRTALLSMAIGVLFVVLGPLLSIRTSASQVASRRAIKLSATLFGLLIIFISYPGTRALLWRFEMVFTQSQSESLVARYDSWEYNIDLFQRSPLVGVGPIKRGGIVAGDSDWLLTMRSYGIVGVFAFVGIMLAPIISSKGPKRHLNYAIFVATSINMITSNVFHSLTLMPLLLIILGTISAPEASCIRLRQSSPCIF